MIAATPASSKDLARSVASTSVSVAQPLVATLPPRASMPTATWPGKARAAARTKSGSSTATVPRMTRASPLLSHVSMVAISRMPPPSWAGTLHAARIASTGAAFTGAPANAPFKSTRCNHWHPACSKARACAAGSSLKTVALSMSPCTRRTACPSFRSMAGYRIILFCLFQFEMRCGTLRQYLQRDLGSFLLPTSNTAQNIRHNGGVNS